jgi:hypothetical protein
LLQDGPVSPAETRPDCFWAREKRIGGKEADKRKIEIDPGAGKGAADAQSVGAELGLEEGGAFPDGARRNLQRQRGVPAKRAADDSEERMREYPNHLGLQLLKMHRETAIEAESDMPEEDVEEVRERIVRKLQ